MHANLNGMRIWYELNGEQGSPVLLLMGFGMSCEAWAPQVATLEKSHQVIRMDNRGVARSAAVHQPYKLQDMATDAVALLDKLCHRDVHVVGVSMGGMIAQELALRYPERVRSLTLIATHAGGPKYLPKAKAIALFIKANTSRGSARIDALAKLLYPAAVRREFMNTTDDSGISHELSNPIAKQTLRFQLAAVAQHGTRRRLKQLRGKPTLIVKPTEDILVPPAGSDELHLRIPGSRLISFSDAGHGITEQCAQELNAHLLGHFAYADEFALSQMRSWSRLRVA